MARGEVTVTLPTARSEPCKNMGEYAILLYGREKIGKTSLCSHFDDTLFLMFEPGAKALSIYQMTITSWRDFKATVETLKKESRFKTVVIDTVDVAYKSAEDFICKRLGIQHPSDEDYGKAWSMVRDELLLTIYDLANTGRGIVFISHEETRTLTTRRGAKRDFTQPSMPGGCKRVVEPLVDIWMRYAFDSDGNRSLQIRGDDEIAAGHRLVDHFVGLSEIPCGNSSREAYENFSAAFNGSAAKPVKKKVRVKTKESA